MLVCMDSSAILKGHGWRGLGYSLDEADRGLKRPLLVSKKVDVLGLGKQKHAQADQWWLRAFDESLKQIGTGQKTLLSSIREHGVDRGSLYGCFIKGGLLEGTISESPSPSDQTPRHLSAPTNIAQAIPEPVAQPPADIPQAVVHEKRRLEEEPRAKVRKRRKLERTEESQKTAEKNAEKVTAEGTFDTEADGLKRKMKHVKQVNKPAVEKRLKAGEFEPILPHQNLAQGASMKKFQGAETGKASPHKAAKCKREKKRRIEQAETKETHMHEIYPEIAPPSIKFDTSVEDVLAYKAAKKEEKKAARAAKREKEEHAATIKEERLQAKLVAKRKKREARKVENTRDAEGITEMKTKQAVEGDVSENLKQGTTTPSNLEKEKQSDEAEVDLIDLNTISQKKRRQYIEKATAKGISIKDYINERNQKKLNAGPKLKQDRSVTTFSGVCR